MESEVWGVEKQAGVKSSRALKPNLKILGYVLMAKGRH